MRRGTFTLGPVDLEIASGPARLACYLANPPVADAAPPTLVLCHGYPSTALGAAASAGAAIAWLHANAEMLEERRGPVETAFDIRISETDWARFQRQFGALV